MNAIKRHPFFAAWIVLCAILLTGGLYRAHDLRQRVRHELSGLAQKNRQRDQLLAQAGLPHPDSTVALPAVGTAALVPAAVETRPSHPLDALIEIAGAQEMLRRLAADQEVALRADESFGFAAYAHEGPRENQLVAVHRQLALVRMLVGKLFAARPGKLVAVQREQPAPFGQEVSQETARDFFQLDPRLDLRVAGLIEGRSVRLEFTGPTRVLRTFLNSLAEAPEPLLVRSVEVEPGSTSSKYSVEVQLVEPVAPTGIAGMTAGNPAVAALWTAPAGENQEQELFVPHEAGRGSLSASVKSVPTDGVELLAVQREPYRLQLVGYFGAPGHYTGTFISPGSPETLLAQVGHHFESLGLTLKKLEVASRAGLSGDEVTPGAVLWDEHRQETVALIGRERLLTDTLVAILRVAPLPAKPRRFRTGETFRDGSAACVIERIQLDPAEVVIVREVPGQPSTERRVLQPIAARSAPAGTDLAVAGHTK